MTEISANSPEWRGGNRWKGRGKGGEEGEEGDRGGEGVSPLQELKGELGLVLTATQCLLKTWVNLPQGHRYSPSQGFLPVALTPPRSRVQRICALD